MKKFKPKFSNHYPRYVEDTCLDIAMTKEEKNKLNEKEMKLNKNKEDKV